MASLAPAGPQDIVTVRMLFAEYAREVDEPRCFTDFERELEGLPGPYFALLLAREEDAPAGCVALRDLGVDTVEMKRLFVRAPYRGRGIGRSLVDAAIVAARERRSGRVVLDTLPKMREALCLYQSFGFSEIAPYLERPTPGARCFELTL